MSVLLFLSALAAMPALPAADSADGRCVFLLGYLGAHGTIEQDGAAQRMIPFFLGRLSARNPDAAIAGIVARAVDEAKAGNVNSREEGARCQTAFTASTGAFAGGIRAAVKMPPRSMATPSSPRP